jgi:hypothetical protein
MIYAATGRELWSLNRTLHEFATTSVGLGLAISSLLAESTLSVALLSGATFFSAMTYIPKCLDWRAASRLELSWSDFSGRSGQLLRSKLRNVLFSGLACVGFAGVLGGAASFIQSDLMRTAITTVAVVILVASQLLARWLYFASVVFARMPGATT